MNQKIISSIQKYIFVGYIVFFAAFLFAGFMLESADIVVFLYKGSAVISLSLLLLTILAFVFYFINIISTKKDNKDAEATDKRSFRFVAYSLLRFAISFLLFAFQMVLKMLAFGQFFK